MFITALALLSSPADARPSTELCRTAAMGTVKVTSSACSCLAEKEVSPDWWGNTSAGALSRLLYSPDVASAAGLCFEVSAVAITSTDARYVSRYASNILGGKSKVGDPRAVGLYWLDETRTPEHVIWADIDGIDDTPPFIVAMPLPWDPNHWGLHDGHTGALLASTTGNGFSVSHAVYDDFDDDGLMDMMVAFEDGAVWELNGITDPYELFTPPVPGGGQQQP
jgi:hypothetical protein